MGRCLIRPRRTDQGVLIDMALPTDKPDLESVRKKILIILPTLDQSGAEKQFCLLAVGLPKELFDVRVITLSRGGPLEATLHEHGIPLTILHKRRRFDPGSILQVRRTICEWKPDIALSALFAANSTLRLATCGLGRPPRRIISERCVDSWKSSWQLALDRLLIRQTDCLVANSESVRRFYADHGFPEKRITVIPNGVETPPPPLFSRTDFCRELGLPESAKLVAFVGRLARQKRLRDLLWASQLLRQADERVCLVLVGDGPERHELEIYSRDIEVSNYVRFTGHRSDAASLLHLVDVFWLGSDFEGMSNSLMEAMATGRPCVVSDIPANRELITHDATGFLVAPGDSVGFMQFTLRLLNDEQLAKRIGQSAAEHMRTRFSVAAMIERYSNLFLQG